MQVDGNGDPDGAQAIGCDGFGDAGYSGDDRLKMILMVAMHDAHQNNPL